MRNLTLWYITFWPAERVWGNLKTWFFFWFEVCRLRALPAKFGVWNLKNEHSTALYGMAKMSQNPYVFLNVFFWEYFKRSYWTLPQRLCILMNIYRLFKFSTLGSVSLHVTPQQIISNASSLYMTQLLAGEEPNNFQQFSTIFSWTKNHFYH